MRQMDHTRLLAKATQGCVMSSVAETSEAEGRKIIRCLGYAANEPLGLGRSQCGGQRTPTKQEDPAWGQT